VVGKALDLLGVEHGLSKSWDGPGDIERKGLRRRR